MISKCNWPKKNAVLWFVVVLDLFLFSFVDCVCANQLDDIFLSVSDALLLRERDSKAIFIDVRDQNSFAKAHIPSSINIPLHFVKTKSYLKNMRLILVSEGYDYHSLLKERSRLSEKGFSSFVLAGGIVSWCQQQQRVKPDNGSCSGINFIPANRIDPEFFFREKIALYDFSGESNNEIFSEETDVPIESEDKLDWLKRDIKVKDLSVTDRIAIFNKNADYSMFANFSKGVSPALFFLEGGYEGYLKSVEDMKAMQAPVEMRTKKIGGCPTCPPLVETN